MSSNPYHAHLECLINHKQHFLSLSVPRNVFFVWKTDINFPTSSKHNDLDFKNGYQYLHLFKIFFTDLSCLFRDVKIEIFHLLNHCLVLTVGMGQAEIRNQEPNLGLLHEWQGHDYCCHQLLPPRVCISRKLESGTELGLESWYPTWDVSVTSGTLIIRPNVQPETFTYLRKLHQILCSTLWRTL